jgi:hypothetical protein
MSEETSASSTSQLITEIRHHSASKNNMLDLAAALARNLQVAWIEHFNWQGRLDSEIQREDLVRAIQNHLPQVPQKVRSFLTDESLGIIDLMRRAYAIVDIVDYLVGTQAHPNRPPDESPWEELVYQLRLYGRYNPDRSLGSVIPAPPELRRPRDRVGRLLCFTSPLGPYTLCWRLIDVPEGQHVEKGRFASIPAPHRADAASHQVKPNIPSPHYWVVHNCTSDEKHQTVAAFRETVEQRFPIVALPETAVDPPLLAEIAAEFRMMAISNSEQRCPFLLIAGHTNDGEPGFNCVSVFKWDGNLAWLQSKVHPWNINNKTIQEKCLCLPLLDDDHACYREWLKVSAAPEVMVADSPFGRLMVAICEDEAHLEPTQTVAIESAVDLLFVLVVDLELESQRWYHRHARTLAEHGITTAVIGPAWLEQHARKEKAKKGSAGNAKSANEPISVILVCRPGPGEPTLFYWNQSEGQLWVDATLLP